MDNPDITMEEYIQLEAKKVRRHGQEFNWETATYGKVRYFEDIDYFKDFETDFPAIVYKDALTSEPGVSSKPTCLPGDNSECNFQFFIESVFPGLNTAYSEIWIRRIDFLTLLNENEDFGGVFIFWNSVCCSHAGIQTLSQHTILLINATWRIIPSKSQGSLSF
ncbi:hypothetical protein Tco_0931785 [Tanacetum coccineum]